jgi:serine protease DegQ
VFFLIFLQRLLTVVISSVISVVLTIFILNNQQEHEWVNEAKMDTDRSTFNIADIASQTQNSVLLVHADMTSVGEKEEEVATGTGFVFEYNNEKYILTNEHVVSDGDHIKVTVDDEDTFDVKVIGMDFEHDVAVLKPIKADSLTNVVPLTFADVSNSRVGDPVIALGYPLDVGFTVTSGIISAKEKSFELDAHTYEHLIQTDAAINPGNSGGPLLDASGQVLGINTAITEDSQGLGFAISIDTANRLMKHLIEEGGDDKPFIGVRLDDDDSKLVIATVVDGGPADLGGLKAGDVIRKIDGFAVTKATEFKSYLNKHKIGDTIKLHILRDGKEEDIVIEVKNKVDVMNIQK